MNKKIPEGNVCSSATSSCPCLYDMMFCQLFNKRLDFDEKIDLVRCEECLKMFPNGGTIVPDAS